MRYDAEHKARTRDRVVREAARAIRREGPQAISVGALMASAGLTHGGFYAHFASKEALVAEALDAAFLDAASLYARATEGFAPGEALRRYILAYLSERHRDARETGCPLPALGVDVARMDAPTRERFGAGVARLTERMRTLLAALGRPDAEALASSISAEMVGALTVSRAMPPGPAADVVLHRSLASLLARCGLEPTA